MKVSRKKQEPRVGYGTHASPLETLCTPDRSLETKGHDIGSYELDKKKKCSRTCPITRREWQD